MTAKNVFVLGLDDANREWLDAVPGRQRYRFHPLLDVPELQEGEIPIEDLLLKARERIAAFEGSVDAIVGFWDFPVSSMVPMLCAELGLPSAPLRAVVTCEHKYWSRLEQQKVIEELPRFGVVDLDREARPPQGLSYPMWVKPIKGFSSELAFRVDDEERFVEAVAAIREGVARVGEPFEFVLDQIDLPPEIAEVGGQACLAEEALTGDQVATEGYVYRGEVVVYGVLDSINYPDKPVFLRHQYPSQLPDAVVRRLKDISRRVIGQVGLDNSTFSIEFFHDPDTGGVTLLEINPRHSQSHAALFEYVDGVPNHHAMLRLALGEDPELRQGQGRYGIAAKYYHRRFTDGIVRAVPDAGQIERTEREIPGVSVYPVPRVGQRLSALDGQDSYSYELTDVVVGADTVAELEDKYHRVVESLRYRIDEIPNA